MVVLLQKENEEEEVKTHVVLHSHVVISFWGVLSSVHRHKAIGLIDSRWTIRILVQKHVLVLVL